MGYLKQISKALAAGVATGTLFYILASVASAVTGNIAPAAGFALGFASAVAISLSSEE